MLTIYIPESTECDLIIPIISYDEIKHLRAHRKKTGDTIRIINGKGLALSAVLTKFDSKGCVCKVIEQVPSNEPEHPRIVLLGQVPQSSVDIAFENGVALGLTSIVVFPADRSQPIHLRNDRLQKIGLAAVKQSERSVIPEFIQSSSLQEAVTLCKTKLNSNGFFCYGDKFGHGLDSYSDQISNLLGFAVAIGPEGGFSQNEINYFLTRGFHPLKLGPRILRTELAVTASLSLFCNHI